jgi:AraC-like DNA-binding protein
MNYKELKKHGTFDFPIELYHIEKEHPEYEMSYHWHLEDEIILILEGELKITLNQKEIHAQKNDIVFVNSGTLHSAIPKDCIYECIVFDMNLLYKQNDVCKNYIDCIINRLIIINDYYKKDKSFFYKTVCSLFEVLKHKHNGYQLIVKGILYQMIGIVFKDMLYNKEIDFISAKIEKNVANLKKVLMFIKESYDKTITLLDLSDIAGMSPKYFCYFFKEMTHKSPIEYLTIYRIECAAYQLRNTNDPVTDIAYDCGFNDLSYFIKTFKKYKNTTPRKFREI